MDYWCAGTRDCIGVGVPIDEVRGLSCKGGAPIEPSVRSFLIPAGVGVLRVALADVPLIDVLKRRVAAVDAAGLGVTMLGLGVFTLDGARMADLRSSDSAPELASERRDEGREAEAGGAEVVDESRRWLIREARAPADGAVDAVLCLRLCYTKQK